MMVSDKFELRNGIDAKAACLFDLCDMSHEKQIIYTVFRLTRN